MPSHVFARDPLKGVPDYLTLENSPDGEKRANFVLSPLLVVPPREESVHNAPHFFAIGEKGALDFFPVRKAHYDLHPWFGSMTFQ